MAAPSAPVIRVMQNGYGVIWVMWPAVAGATSYKVYADDFATPTTLIATVTDALSDGSFAYLSGLLGTGPAYVAVVATNDDGDSDPSNERVINISVGQETEPTSALKHAKAM